MGPWVLLVFLPMALGLEFFHRDPTMIFVASALAIIPLAGLLGLATEHLAGRVGPALGGLVNASLGNAAELIIAIMALREGLHDVVKASLTGSIIGNILLVLGLAMFAGGLKHRTQHFNRTSAGLSASLLLLAAVGLIVPALFHAIASPQALKAELDLSLEIAIVLFAIYILSLVFSLQTHRALLAGEQGMSQSAPHVAWSLRKTFVVLSAAAAALAVMSELLVGAIGPVAEALGLTEVFMGVILVALVGNAAEHSTAVLAAMKNQMDLALGIAVAASLQVALFVAPLLVFLSYLLDDPLNLIFTEFEVAAVFLSVLIVSFVATDGESHWMEGVMLVGVYVILAVAFFFLPA